MQRTFKQRSLPDTFASMTAALEEPCGFAALLPLSFTFPAIVHFDWDFSVERHAHQIFRVVDLSLVWYNDYI